MTHTVLGLDIGGANLKAATADRRAVSVPFPLWKQPDKLGDSLAALIAQFPKTMTLAVTMTGELCDCFPTLREGVLAILDEVERAAGKCKVRIWTTDGQFVKVAKARKDTAKVAAANWHALATYAVRFCPNADAALIDIGSTTTDLIAIRNGKPDTVGHTDTQRLDAGELLYLGTSRTPVFAFGLPHVAAEFFATMRDVYTILGEISEDDTDTDTADNRPATIAFSLARLARARCADRETMSDEAIRQFALSLRDEQIHRVREAFQKAILSRFVPKRLILSGSGEFLLRSAFASVRYPLDSLSDKLGKSVSGCAPAYAVAVLATENPA